MAESWALPCRPKRSPKPNEYLLILINNNKMVVQKKLRALIHPELIVINVDGTPENKLPDTYYTEEEESKEVEEMVSVYDKIKNMLLGKNHGE